MDTESNKAAKLRYFEAFNSQDIDALDSLFTADYVLHMADGTDFHGLEPLKEMVSMTWAGLTNPRLAVEDMVAEGQGGHTVDNDGHPLR